MHGLQIGIRIVGLAQIQNQTIWEEDTCFFGIIGDGVARGMAGTVTQIMDLAITNIYEEWLQE